MATTEKRERQPREERLGFRVDGPTKALIQRAAQLERRKLTDFCVTALPMPKAADSPLLYSFCCFPPASPAFAPGAGKQKAALRDRFKSLILFRKFGAGEGIRTLDPNLGKVVLYP
jgi:Protein of unknown function (DUF1778)